MPARRRSLHQSVYSRHDGSSAVRRRNGVCRRARQLASDASRRQRIGRVHAGSRRRGVQFPRAPRRSIRDPQQLQAEASPVHEGMRAVRRCRRSHRPCRSHRPVARGALHRRPTPPRTLRRQCDAGSPLPQHSRLRLSSSGTSSPPTHWVSHYLSDGAADSPRATYLRRTWHRITRHSSASRADEARQTIAREHRCQPEHQVG